MVWKHSSCQAIQGDYQQMRVKTTEINKLWQTASDFQIYQLCLIFNNYSLNAIILSSSTSPALRIEGALESVTSLLQVHTQRQTTIHTQPAANLQLPVSLMCMCLDCGRKPQNLKRTNMDTENMQIANRKAPSLFAVRWQQCFTHINKCRYI